MCDKRKTNKLSASPSDIVTNLPIFNKELNIANTIIVISRGNDNIMIRNNSPQTRVQ